MDVNTSEHAFNLADTTVRAFNGDVTSVSILDSISLIDSWISLLRDYDQQTNAIADNLSNLKAELQTGNPDGTQVQQILTNLVHQTQQVADPKNTDVKTKANTLAQALQSFSQQLSGASGQANTGGQAPMTSTVGGESTNSGTGNSAADSSDDSLAGRLGGIISNDSAPDQDEKTGAEPDSTTGETATTGSGTTDSTGDDKDEPSNAGSSRSDSARVDGPGFRVARATPIQASREGGRSIKLGRQNKPLESRLS